MLRVLCAPDKFRGALTAREAAQALARGVRAAGGRALLLPIADGGEGTLDALGWDRRICTVAGPGGRPRAVQLGWSGTTCFVETAQICGHEPGPPPLRDRSTAGVGEAVLEAVRRGARRVILGLGGSATADGGVGMLRVLGGRSPGAEGALWDGGAILDGVVGLAGPAWSGADLEAWCDVRATLAGEGITAADFVAQKGADAGDWAARFQRLAALGGDQPGAGAAGGLGWALGRLGAQLRPGAEAVLAAVGFDDAARDVDLVLTGEGAFDATSLGGKGPGEVLRRAGALGIAAAVVAGRVLVEPGVPWRQLTELGSSPQLAATAAGVTAAAQELTAAAGLR